MNPKDLLKHLETDKEGTRARQFLLPRIEPTSGTEKLYRMLSGYEEGISASVSF